MAESKSMSFYATPNVQQILDDRAAEGERSTVIARIVERYAQVCVRDKPDLAEKEWNLLRDALNGTWLGEASHVRFIPAEIKDAIAHGALDKKWKVDGRKLVENLNGLSYAGLVALADDVERFWRRQ